LRGILEICLEYEITALVAVMEPALLRTLARVGLYFEPIGPLVDYHGLRQPCIAEIATLVKNSRDQASLLWNYLEASGSVRALSAPPDQSANVAAARTDRQAHSAAKRCPGGGQHSGSGYQPIASRRKL
jgi:hypothetical protein